MKARVRTAAGSRSFSHLVRHPGEILSGPSRNRAEQDLRAWRDGVPLRVACFLRGTAAPFPSRVRQGHLLLDAAAVTWFPFPSAARSGLSIPVPAAITGVRAPGKAEWSVKRAGRALGVIPVAGWQTIAVQAGGVSLELTITEIDKSLVEAALGVTTSGP